MRFIFFKSLCLCLSPLIVSHQAARRSTPSRPIWKLTSGLTRVRHSSNQCSFLKMGHLEKKKNDAVAQLVFLCLRWHHVARQSVVFPACVCKCIPPHFYLLPNIRFRQNRWKWHTSASGWLSGCVVNVEPGVPPLSLSPLGSQFLSRNWCLNRHNALFLGPVWLVILYKYPSAQM